LITVPELSAEALGSFLAEHLNRNFGSTHAHLAELIPSIARIALECIGNSDALYHNVEHTMLVTLVGYDIMKGRALLTPTLPSDFAHLVVACLMHDIGYVRGIVKGDDADGFVIDSIGSQVALPRGASDAALMPYHVDRSKLYVLVRAGSNPMLDAQRFARVDPYGALGAGVTTVGPGPANQIHLAVAAVTVTELAAGEPVEFVTCDQRQAQIADALGFVLP